MEIVVIGSTIAGLATALNLRQQGHNITLVKSSEEVQRQDRSFIPCPPNMTRLLKKWGFECPLRYIASTCNLVDFREGVSGDILASLDWDEDVLMELGAEFLVVEGGVLRGLLRQAAIDDGVVFIDASLDSLNLESCPVFLRLKGEDMSDIWLLADMIIIADTLPKHILEICFEARPDPTRQYRHYMFQISKEAMRDDTDLNQLLDPNTWLIWFLEDGYELTGTVASPEGVFEGRISWPAIEADQDDTYESIVSSEHLDDCKPILDKILEYAEETEFVTTSGYYTTSIVGGEGRVILVGEAAHPPVPGNIYAAALAIEEAEMLACILPRWTDPDGIQKLLIKYEETHKTLCTAVQKCGYSHIYLHDYFSEQVMWISNDDDKNCLLGEIWQNHRNVHSFDVKESRMRLNLEQPDDLQVLVIKEVTTTSHPL